VTQRVPHAYTTPSSPDAARCWVPCVDNLWEKCTWEFEFVVPRYLEERDQAIQDGDDDLDDALDLCPTIVVCSGELVEQVCGYGLMALLVTNLTPLKLFSFFLKLFLHPYRILLSLLDHSTSTPFPQIIPSRMPHLHLNPKCMHSASPAMSLCSQLRSAASDQR
jgi:hypothetical protein